MRSSSRADATHSVIVLKNAIMRICRPCTWFMIRKTQTILSVRMMRRAGTVELTDASINARITVTHRMMKSNRFHFTRQ